MQQSASSWINPLDVQARIDMGYDAADALSPAQITAWQLTKLRRVCTYARQHSGFYQKRLAGLSLKNFSSRDAFATLPRTTADDLRETPLSFLCLSQDDIARVVTLSTSGSTGKPKRLFFTQTELDETTGFYNHGMQCLTAAGKTVLALLPAPKPDSVGALLVDGLQVLGAHPILHQTPDDVATSLTLFKTHMPDCVVGTAAHVLALVKLWQQETTQESPVESVLLCWDASSQAIRQYIEKVWKCRVHTHWGMTETGLGGAVNCPFSNGMHLRETNIYAEITDPETGRLVPDGERGELVVTTLTRTGMPLIRYRTGDEAHIMQERCPCGSPLRRMHPYIRRLAHPADTPEWLQNITPSTVDELLIAAPDVLAQQAHYKSATNTLEITVDMRRNSSQELSSIHTILRNAIVTPHPPVNILCHAGTMDNNISIGFEKRRIRVE